MPRPLLSLVTSSLLLWQPLTTTAYPGSAGQCPKGMPAVSGPHTSSANNPTTGSLAEGDLTLLLNGEPLTGDGNPETVTFFPGDEVNTLELSGASPFRGFLIRVGEPNGITVNLQEALVPTDDNSTVTLSQVASTTCVDVEQVGGMTHTSRDDKSTVSGDLVIPLGVPQISVDVTVVVVASSADEVSTYYYSNFLIDAAQVETEAPVEVETPEDGDAAMDTNTTAIGDGSNATTAPEDNEEEQTIKDDTTTVAATSDAFMAFYASTGVLSALAAMLL